MCLKNVLKYTDHTDEQRQSHLKFNTKLTSFNKTEEYRCFPGIPGLNTIILQQSYFFEQNENIGGSKTDSAFIKITRV